MKFVNGILAGTLTSVTAFQLLRTKIQDDHKTSDRSLKRMKQRLEGTIPTQIKVHEVDVEKAFNDSFSSLGYFRSLEFIY
jgi:hypothetical protein